MQRTESVVPPIPAAVLSSSPHLQLSELLRVLQAVRDGDFSVRLPGDWTGLEGKIADTVNEMVMSNARMASELERVGIVVGDHHAHGGHTSVPVAACPKPRRCGRPGDERSAFGQSWGPIGPGGHESSPGSEPLACLQ